MRLVNIDDEPFEAAPVAAAREQMTTACSMWASVEPRLVLQIKLTAWPALLAGSVRQLLQGVLTEGTQISAAERAFFTRSSREVQPSLLHLPVVVPRPSVVGLGSAVFLQSFAKSACLRSDGRYTFLAYRGVTVSEVASLYTKRY